MKLTRKQIEIIIKNTKPELKGKPVGSGGIIEELGTYIPSEANWGYHAGYTANGDLVVTRFGEVM